MTVKPLLFYPHRHNRDGSFDSICVRCFATIATADDITELHAYEKNHVCAGTAVAQRNEVNRLRSSPISQTPASYTEPNVAPGYETRGPTPSAGELQRW
jgi:hypothetical protein